MIKDTDTEDTPSWPRPSLLLGPNSPGTYLHRKTVNGGNPYFTPHEANTQGVNLPDVRPLRGAPPAQ